MELKGYRLPEKIKLVVNQRKQAFVVDPNSKGSLETALNWARIWDREQDKYIEGEVIETDNKGFKMEFLESADHSSQGGKLSFWDCKVTKNGESYIIGINQDLLLELIKCCTIINGKVQEDCCFIKQKGNTGLVVEHSEFYNKCMEEINLRNQKLSEKKTSSWEPGHYYESLTQQDMYLIDVYVWYEEFKISWYETGYTMLERPIRKRLIVDKYIIKENKTLSEIFKDDQTLMLRFDYMIKDKLPARSKSDSTSTIKIDMVAKDLEQVKQGTLVNFEQLKKDFWIPSSGKIKLLLTTFDKNPPNLSNSDKEYLRKQKVQNV